MVRPRAKELAVHTRHRFKKLKDGTTAVYLIEYQYDYATQNNKVLRQKTIGYLPEGCTDLKDMVPVEAPKRGPKPGSRRKKQPACRIVYPSCAAFAVLMMCAGAGLTAASQVAEFWKGHYEEMQRLFAGWRLPHELSQETVRDFYLLLGRTSADGVAKAFHALLQEEGVRQELERLDSLGLSMPAASDALQKKSCALDSQTVLAGRADDGSWTLSVYAGAQAGAQGADDKKTTKKKNKMSAGELLGTLDVRGGVVTTSAFPAQAEFAKSILEAGADYCIGVSAGPSSLEDSVRSKFQAEEMKGMLCTGEGDAEDVNGSGLAEHRIVSILPASLLESEILDKWPGLEDGCIVEVKSAVKPDSLKAENKADECRYYAASLQFKRNYIAKQVLQIIKCHCETDNARRWLFDVTYNDDRARCANSCFIRGKQTLKKLLSDFGEAVQRAAEKERGTTVQGQDMKPAFASLHIFLYMISKVCMFTSKEAGRKIL